MKVGTDGVLLGAWASVAHRPNAILDIGAGTGLIALMLAQRCDAEIIDAVELEVSAFEQCVANFESSPWGDRLFCYHASLQEFAGEIDDQYQLIVSNPPYYAENSPSADLARDMARQNLSLPFQDLLGAVRKLLSRAGKFVLIVPFKEETMLIREAAKYGLYAARILHVKGNPEAEVKRSLMEFQRDKTKTIFEELTIEIARQKYTSEYIGLTKDFYLKM